jgi:hypothetical protein
MAAEMKGAHVGGDGETVEVDGAYFGGHVRPANLKENRRDRRLVENQTGKRRVVVVAREREGRTISGVFKTEGASVTWIRDRVATGSRIVADCTDDMPWIGSTTPRLTAWTGFIRTVPSPFSLGCVAARLATTTI